MLEYKKICKELGIDQKGDRDARDIAASIIGETPQPLQKLESLIRHHDVVVFGAGPSLEESVKTLDKQGKTLIAADGATSCLLSKGFYPDIIVTDLDGKMSDLLLANRFGAIAIIHAHGDNIDKIKKFLPQFKNAVVTTQVEPLKNCHNFFGFTDGDRAVFLAKHFGARTIDLVGFDYGAVVGKYSKPEEPSDHPADERKKKKLDIAERLVKKALELG
jgi:2-amino-4-hydroxy-6-hydroxymethyldihydropteridine diphosphokinase